MDGLMQPMASTFCRSQCSYVGLLSRDCVNVGVSDDIVMRDTLLEATVVVVSNMYLPPPGQNNVHLKRKKQKSQKKKSFQSVQVSLNTVLCFLCVSC